jgi:hypothetical protein
MVSAHSSARSCRRAPRPSSLLTSEIPAERRVREAVLTGERPRRNSGPTAAKRLPRREPIDAADADPSDGDS